MKDLKKIARQPQNGFTLTELVIGTALTLTVSALALQGLTSSQQDFASDRTNIETGQKLSSVLDIISRDIRQAGEEISEPQFPVIRIAPDSGRGSKIILYRALAEPLAVCSTGGISNGTTVSATDGVITGVDSNASLTVANPSCKRNDPLMNVWNSFRTSPSNTSQQLPVALYDNSGGIQEDLLYTGELIAATGSDSKVTIVSNTNGATSFTATRTFPLGNATIYLIEKREYLICNDNLKVLVNSPDSTTTSCSAADSETFQTVATNVEKMDITTYTRTAAAVFTDPDIVSSSPVVNSAFPSGTLNWQNIQGLEIQLKAKDVSSGTTPMPAEKLIAKGKFYPRNVLSAKTR